MDDDITTGPGFLARSKKALGGGVSAAAAGFVATFTPAIADQVFVWPDEFWPVLTMTVGGFALGFAGVWFTPKNAE